MSWSMDNYKQWLATRPAPVQVLAAEFPLLTRLKVGHMLDDPWFVVGYTDDDHLIVSPVSPAHNYFEAMDKRMRVCAAHFRGGSDGEIGKAGKAG